MAEETNVTLPTDKAMAIVGVFVSITISCCVGVFTYGNLTAKVEENSREIDVLKPKVERNSVLYHELTSKIAIMNEILGRVEEGQEEGFKRMEDFFDRQYPRQPKDNR